jgi:hypothetical protein
MLDTVGFYSWVRLKIKVDKNRLLYSLYSLKALEFRLNLSFRVFGLYSLQGHHQYA